MAGITGITFFRPDACTRINKTQKCMAPIILQPKCTIKSDMKSRLHKIHLSQKIPSSQTII
jgi:hypothetical protein